MRLLLFLSIAMLTSAESCQEIPPLSFPITDIQVRPDIPQSLVKGVSATIGSPPQNIVLLPWPELNNTFVYDERGYCDKTVIWNDLICEVRRGGLYAEDNSSTFDREQDIRAAGGATTETELPGSELGIGDLMGSSVGATETFSLGNVDSSLKSFPVGVPRFTWDHGYTLNHAMGMGRNSTFLNSLVFVGKISSRVWSVFWGRMWVSDPLDGSLVLGGYDTDKVIGGNFTAPLDYSSNSGCWTGMKVQITGLTLNNRNGTDAQLLDSSTNIGACIVPQRQLLLEAPQSLINTFEGLTGMRHEGQSFGLHWSSYLYGMNGIYDGDLTISLSSGLRVRIPNDQFIVPYVDIDRQGRRFIDTSRRELLFNGLSDQPATLGRYFLTAAYLMVDHDEHTYTMWKANPSKKSTLVPVMGPKARAQCQSSVVPGANSGSSTDADGDISTSSGQSGISTGAIAGIVIGVVVVLLVVGGGIYWWFFHRRVGSTSAEETMPASLAPKKDETTNISERHLSELHGSPPPPRPAWNEVHGNHSFVHEMDGQHLNR